MTLTYRKIGGIHWMRIGRVCISLCLVRRDPAPIALIQHPGEIQHRAKTPAMPRIGDFHWPRETH